MATTNTKSGSRSRSAKRTSSNGNSASAAGKKKPAATRSRKPSAAQRKTAAGAAKPPKGTEEQVPAVGVLIQIQRTDDLGNFAITSVTPLGGVLPGEVMTVCEMGVRDFRNKLGLPTAK